jgi:hypothetical protein
MRDDVTGLDMGMLESPCRKTGGARLWNAGIAKSDANNFVVSDEPDTSAPSHSDIEPLDYLKEA